MSRTPSFVTIPSAKVREMAQDCLDRIERRNQRVLNGAVEARYQKEQKYVASWWGRLWRAKLPTKEHIRESILSDHWTAMDLQMYAWGSRDAAERLLKAAKYADTVQVSSEDLDMLG